MPPPADLQDLTAPFVAQLSKRAGTILAPEPATGSGDGHQWLLANGSAIRLDWHQRGDWTAMSGNDRRTALLGGLEKIRELIASFFRALAQDGVHHVCLPSDRTAPYRISQWHQIASAFRTFAGVSTSTTFLIFVAASLTGRRTTKATNYAPTSVLNDGVRGSASEGICARVYRVGQDVMDGWIDRRSPNDAVGRVGNRQLSEEYQPKRSDLEWIRLWKGPTRTKSISADCGRKYRPFH
jgi:hypothetical protein